VTGYLDLPDQRIFVEEHGGGEPMFLLHGVFAGADSWVHQIPALSAEYHVFVPERRGHGRSPDVPGPYTTEVFAAETAAVIQTLAQGPAHLVGWSDGAYVAAYLALHRPDLVRSAVLIGQAYSREGETEAVRALMHDPDLAGYFRESYAKTSPDGPEHFDVVFDKIVTLWRNPLDMPIDDFARVTAPVLVMQGDDDGVRIEYSLALARALPLGQFAVVPGTGHGAPIQRAGVVNRMILDFLADRQPERMIALGSLHDLPTDDQAQRATAVQRAGPAG
jgi:pimeloyl-ACP methyl ester carboxylesterase